MPTPPRIYSEVVIIYRSVIQCSSLLERQRSALEESIRAGR